MKYGIKTTKIEGLDWYLLVVVNGSMVTTSKHPSLQGAYTKALELGVIL